MKTLNLFSAVALSGLMLASCKKDDDNNNGNNPANPQPASFKVRMTDGPGEFSAMNMQVTKVEAYFIAEGQSSGSWRDLNSNSQSIDVMELNNGEEMVMAYDNTADAGMYSKLRITFGSENRLWLVGEESGLGLSLGFTNTTEQQTEIQIDEQVSEHDQHEVLLDFNVAESVEHTGSSYFVHPRIHEVEDEHTGARGRLMSSSRASILFESQDHQHTYHTYTNNSGQFLIRGMANGTYDMICEGRKTGQNTMSQSTVHGVVVVNGEIKNMGDFNW